jgi:hypothetical protein
MKPAASLALLGLLVPFVARPAQEADKPKKAESAVTRFFQDEVERMNEAVEGSWALLDYVDPNEHPEEGAAGGFALFHDGFLMLLLTVDTYEARLFRAREFVLVNSGAYRYRFDGQARLQLASVMSVSNQTEDGELEHEPSNQVYEYTTTLDDQVLELRNADGVTLSFRRVTSKDFPESAARKLESQRSGQPRWEELDEDERPR